MGARLDVSGRVQPGRPPSNSEHPSFGSSRVHNRSLSDSGQIPNISSNVKDWISERQKQSVKSVTVRHIFGSNMSQNGTSLRCAPIAPPKKTPMRKKSDEKETSTQTTTGTHQTTSTESFVTNTQGITKINHINPKQMSPKVSSKKAPPPAGKKAPPLGKVSSGPKIEQLSLPGNGPTPPKGLKHKKLNWIPLLPAKVIS